MKVYDVKSLEQELGIGREAAYRILRDYGFRTGYTNKSPLRITERGLERFIEERRREIELIRDRSSDRDGV